MMINPLHQPQQVFLLEKVLGFDQAKRRLQAFAKSKAAYSFKGKSSAIFAEDDDDYPVRDNSDNQSPMVKNSTHIIASIMKEETESRESIKKNIEKLARNTEEVQSDNMKDSNYKSSKILEMFCGGKGKQPRKVQGVIEVIPGKEGVEVEAER